MGIEIESFSFEGLNIEYDDKKSITDDAKKRMSAMFIAVREKSGMNRKEFAEWLGIPYRTMQDWERGVSQVPDYVLRLVAYKVKMEDYLKRGILKYDDSEENVIRSERYFVVRAYNERTDFLVLFRSKKCV